MLKSIGIRDAELSILFVGDRAMRSLNRRYRRRDKTTDVLSFPLGDTQFTHIRPSLLGDIVISVPVASRQAAGAGHSFLREIDILLIHGLLHLLGYDHEQSEKEARRMKREEARLLNAISS